MKRADYRRSIVDAARRGDKGAQRKVNRRAAKAQMTLFGKAPDKPSNETPFNDSIDHIGR